jgi:hypothetical protein
VTLPALMQDVQTFSRFGVPFTVACTVWMFGFQRRRVRRCEWEMLLPKPGPLPQTSQVAAMVDTLSNVLGKGRAPGVARTDAVRLREGT